MLVSAELDKLKMKLRLQNTSSTPQASEPWYRQENQNAQAKVYVVILSWLYRCTVITVWGNYRCAFCVKLHPSTPDTPRHQVVLNCDPFYPLDPVQSRVNGYYIESVGPEGVRFVTLFYQLSRCIKLHLPTNRHFMTSGNPKVVRYR